MLVSYVCLRHVFIHEICVWMDALHVHMYGAGTQTFMYRVYIQCVCARVRDSAVYIDCCSGYLGESQILTLPALAEPRTFKLVGF